MQRVGRCVSFRDEAGQWFSFDICLHCTLRLDRLPIRLQLRQLDVAVSNLCRQPQRYDVATHDNELEAELVVKLRAAKLRGEF